MNKFKLTVSTPDGNVFNEEVIYLRLRGTEGELAVMAGHASFVTGVVACEVKIELENGEKNATVDGGLLTVSPSGVTLLVGEINFI